MPKPNEHIQVSQQNTHTDPLLQDTNPALATNSSVQVQKSKFNFKDFARTTKGKVLLVLATLLVIIGVVFAVPASRYGVAGLVVKKDLMVEVIDTETNKPVSAAAVTLGGQVVKTDAEGKVTFKHVAVGNWNITAQKSHYHDAQVATVVPILNNPGVVKISMNATGRQVPVIITNKISGKPVGGVEIVAGDATATTTENGEATIVLPADKTTVAATLKLTGYNDAPVTITVTEQQIDANTLTITPAGKVYFLSSRTGRIDVMSAHLDGTGQTVVLAGTGKEDKFNTELLASKDWKYLALVARRDTQTKLYLLDTTDNKLSVIDETTDPDVTFMTEGWYGDTFVYTVLRGNVKAWEPKRFSLKSFNAPAKKLTTLDETEGAGTGIGAWINQVYSSGIWLRDDRVIFVKYWEDHNMVTTLNTKKDQIISVKLDGSDKKVLYEFAAPSTSSIQTRAGGVPDLYIRVGYHTIAPEYYTYKSGVVTKGGVSEQTFYAQGAIYKLSPQGTHTAWQEMRDKLTVLAGDRNGAGGQKVAEGDYYAIGWVGEDYLLLTHGVIGELYIVPVHTFIAKPLKISEITTSGKYFYGKN